VSSESDLHGPGPLSYHVKDSCASPRGKAPHAKFGSSKRDTMAYIEPSAATPGPMFYNTQRLRPTSPHANFGTSKRDTMEYVVSSAARSLSPVAEGAEGGPADSAHTPATRFGSPRIKGGVIGWAGAGPRRAEPERPQPGPCSYNPGAGEHPKPSHPTFGSAPRNTATYLVREGCSPGPSGGDPAPRRGRTVKGGVIGSAPRWCNSNITVEEDRPGPQSYRPRPTVLSTFR